MIKTNIPGSGNTNVVHFSLVQHKINDISRLPSLHIKLGVMKDFVNDNHQTSYNGEVSPEHGKTFHHNKEDMERR